MINLKKKKKKKKKKLIINKNNAWNKINLIMLILTYLYLIITE